LCDIHSRRTECTLSVSSPFDSKDCIDPTVKTSEASSRACSSVCQAPPVQC
jgi:hypothetical protein